MIRSYWFSPGGFASAEPASSSAPKNGLKMCFEERFKPQISVGQHFDAPSFTSKQCFHTNLPEVLSKTLPGRPEVVRKERGRVGRDPLKKL